MKRNKTNTNTERVRERLSPRNTPQQDRSRVRLQALFDAAEEVIAETGLHGLAMREVARRADLPIASIYHYFPSTAALIRALIERQLEKLRGILQAGLRARFPRDASGMSTEQVKALLIAQVSGLIDDIAAFFFETPSASEIWGGLQAYPDLRTLDIEDTKRNAALVQPVFTRLVPSLEPAQACIMAMVLVESVSSTLRLALASPPDVRGQIVATLKDFVGKWLACLFKPPTHEHGLISFK